jgi:hypothetical protein
MTPRRRHSIAVAAAATLVAAGATAIVGFIAGWPAVGRTFGQFEPRWIGLIAGGLVLAYVGYVIAYRPVAAVEGGPELSWTATARLVLVGFAPHKPLGGFAVDRDALSAACADPTIATARVLALGALEWAVLAPVASICAVILLVRGGVSGGLLWPWALAVPAGFGFAFLLETRRQRLAGGGRLRRAMADGLEGITLLRQLLRRRWLTAWAGMAIYWTGEIVALAGALLCFGASRPVTVLILAFATGHTATRRSMPLAGAGATELLLAFALHWVGVGLAAALAAVVVFRIAGLLAPLWPSMAVRRQSGLSPVT